MKLDLRSEEIFCEEAIRFYRERLKEIRRIKAEYGITK